MQKDTKRCSRCGNEKNLDDFRVDSDSPDGKSSMCKLCRNRSEKLRGLDFELLKNPSNISTKTFWRIWRAYAMEPIRKFLHRGVRSSIEGQIVDNIISEIEADFLEFHANVNRKMSRLKKWQRDMARASEDAERRKVREAHRTLEVPIPRKKEQAPIADIKKAYKAKARATHPDMHPGKEDEFSAYNEAYSMLMNYYEVVNGNDKKEKTQ